MQSSYTKLETAIREVANVKDRLTHDYVKAVAEECAEEILDLVIEQGEVDYPGGPECGPNICLDGNGMEALANVLYTVMMKVRELP